jgi:hypothetical protein
MTTTSQLAPALKPFYRLAAVAALLIVAVGLTDMIVSMSAGESAVNSAVTVNEWFALLASRPFAALGNLGLFNLLTLTLGIPVFIALFHAHRESDPGFAALAAVSYFIGAAVYFASNTIFPMLTMAAQYALAPAAEQPLLEATGRTLLASGVDLSAGTFLGFFFSQLAGVIMGIVLIRGQRFGKVAGWLAVIGFSLMLVFFYISAFIPARFNTAMLISAPAGLLLMVYQVLLAIKFFAAAK